MRGREVQIQKQIQKQGQIQKQKQGQKWKFSIFYFFMIQGECLLMIKSGKDAILITPRIDFVEHLGRMIFLQSKNNKNLLQKQN